MNAIIAKILPAYGSLRRRMFFLLGGLCLGTLLVVNLIWLPSAIDDIRQNQRELRRVSVQLIRDQIQMHLDENEEDLSSVARRFRPSLLEGDRERLLFAAQRFLHSETEFEEIGVLDGKGKEIMRLSRRTVVTDRDLADRSAGSLFREGMRKEIHWEPVTITAASEPWVALTVRLPGAAPSSSLKGLVFGVINLRPLWKLTGEFKIRHEGRAYIVDEEGRLIAAADPSTALRQLSFADRPFIQRIIDPRSSDDRLFVEGDYVNEKGVQATATGLLLSRSRWGVVVEQPQAALFAPIRQKIWFFSGLSLLGLFLSYGLAQILSRRLTEPIVRLQEGAQQIGGGNLEYKVSVERGDEIGALARQFNFMAEQLRASQEATLSALTIPVMSHTGEMQEILSSVITKVMSVTEADAASIRLTDDENKEFLFSVCQGFSEAYENDWPRSIRDGGRRKMVLTSGEPFFSGDILDDSDNVANLLAREGFRCAAYLPLQTLQKTFGLITLAGRDPGRLSSKKVDIFKAIAHQISVALQNIKLFQEIEASRSDLEKINRVLTQQTAELDGTNAAMKIEIAERRKAEEQLRHTLISLRKSVNATIQVMVSAVEMRDPYTSGHQIQSAHLACAIATEMGLSQDKIEGVRFAGSIHDIGKLSIPAEILSKPTKLSEIEFSLIKEHSRQGYEILKDVESPWPLAEIVYQHHERMDGSGYPRNLKGEEILIEARILAVADVVEAMASHRPYRPGRGIDMALDEIAKNRGILFDQDAVDACLKLFKVNAYRLGS